MGLIGEPNFGRRISEMEEGEEGYATSGALFFDREMIPYLNRKACFINVKGEDFKIRIKRTGPNKGDYEVDLKGTNYLWSKSEESFGLFKDFELESLGLIKLDFDSPKLERKLSGILELRENLDEAIRRQDYASAARIKQLIKKSSSEQRINITQ